MISFCVTINFCRQNLKLKLKGEWKFSNLLFSTLVLRIIIDATTTTTTIYEDTIFTRNKIFVISIPFFTRNKIFVSFLIPKVPSASRHIVTQKLSLAAFHAALNIRQKKTEKNEIGLRKVSQNFFL